MSTPIDHVFKALVYTSGHRSAHCKHCGFYASDHERAQARQTLLSVIQAALARVDNILDATR